MHPERRKRQLCQYWDRGLADLVTYERPSPGLQVAPPCANEYQLMRNSILAKRLGARLSKRPYALVVKSPKSKQYVKTTSAVASFNNTARNGLPHFKVIGWEDLASQATEFGQPILSHYMNKFA